MDIVEEFRPPADTDCEMAGAPAHSDGHEPDSSVDGARPAAEVELEFAFRPQVIGNPARSVACDDDPLRGNPRDAGDLPERAQCGSGHDEGLRFTCCATWPSFEPQGLEK
eukprot:118958-Pyramimonas_sp.AAC.1